MTERLKGTAASVRVSASTWVHGGGGQANNFVHGGTDHFCTFQIGRQVVRICSGAPAVVEPGDEIVVVGSKGSDGIFHAPYYVNVTRNVRQDRGNSVSALTLGSVCLLLSTGLLLVSAGSRGSDLGILFAGVVSLVGCPILFYEAMARRKTSVLLDQS